MKKFIYKSSLYVLPFFLLHCLNLIFFNMQEGDLIRVSYLYYNPSPQSEIKQKFKLSKGFSLTSEIDLNKRRNFDVLTIGDSFSAQGNLGYQNFLSKSNVSVLDMERSIDGGNPVQLLVNLLNGDFFNYVHLDYVVLESVERSIVQRCDNLDYKKSLKMDSIIKHIATDKKESYNLKVDFFSDAILKIPLANILYRFEDKPRFCQTYKVATNSNQLFFNNPGELLFHEWDVNFMDYKNDTSKISMANSNLNKISNLLSKKNIKLIVLIAPDKYDLYYPYIQNKEKYIKPNFFSHFDSLTKEYLYIKTFEVISNQLDKTKDVYYYDDTHWSPIAASRIALEIKNIIETDK